MNSDLDVLVIWAIRGMALVGGVFLASAVAGAAWRLFELVRG